MNIKEYYKENYPSDEIVEEIHEFATFETLLEKLYKGKDMYEYIGIGDSIVRERLFEKLADMLEVDYGYIYGVWLNN